MTASKSMIDKNQHHKQALTLHHEIFILDANLRILLPNNEQRIIAIMIRELLMILKMEKLASLQFFQATDMQAPGFSFIQPITTSHISGHYFEKPGRFPHIHFDIYSCKRFSWKKIIPLLNNYLSFEKWSANYIARSINFKRKYYEIRGKGQEILDVRCLSREALCLPGQQTSAVITPLPSTI